MSARWYAEPITKEGISLDILTFEQIRLVIVVYSSALAPLFIIPFLHWRRLVPEWVLSYYIKMFFICALGWEIWFNYGLIGGDDVDVRRADALNLFLPLHVNWIFNSLADAGAICCGSLLFLWFMFGRDSTIYLQWNWSIFGLLLMILIGQNLIVEMFLYHDQLAVGKPLSWAPLSPGGPWLNPLLFDYNGRTIMFNTQIPWLIMAPLMYSMACKASWNQRFKSAR